MTQELLQNFYNFLDKIGQNRIVFKIILFLFRSFYATLFSFASVLQYRSYWDFYNGKYEIIVQLENLIIELILFLNYATAKNLKS